MDAAPFESLLDRYQSGEATHEELGELDRQLQADARKRRILVERALLEVQLRKFFGGLAPVQGRRRSPAAWRPSRRWRLCALVLIALALGACLLAVLLRNGGGSAAVVESGVVRVNNVATAVVPMQAPFDVGGRIPAALRLPGGAHAELDVGTRAILAGAAQGSRRIELIAGGGEFAVAAGQPPLHVATSIATLAAESAQFTARLGKGANGSAVLTVAVRSGAVQVESAGQTQTLAAGAERVFAAPVAP